MLTRIQATIDSNGEIAANAKMDLVAQAATSLASQDFDKSDVGDGSQAFSDGQIGQHQVIGAGHSDRRL